MRWVAKAAAQKALSGLPAGDRANHLLQRHITKGFPRSDGDFRLHASETVRHFDLFRRHSETSALAAARFYEFGAGWDLITPIVYHGLGVEHQTLVDIRPNLRFDQVNWTIGQYGRLHDELEREAGCPLRRIDPAPVESLADLERRFGIGYVAPCDARHSGFADDSFDFASSTFTLEHIPRDDIAAILAECRRILKPGGLISSSVDMQDHYSFFDSSITAFNFLKFSDRTWSLANSSLHFQNRLRQPDHRALHEGAGFDVIEETFERPDPADIEALGRLRLAPSFQAGYSEEQLAIRAVSILGRAP